MRICECCGKFPMMDGFYLDGEYLCSDECLEKTYTPKEIEAMDMGGDDSECYWTEWEDEGIDDGDVTCSCCEEFISEGYYLPWGCGAYATTKAEPIFVCDSGCLRKLTLGKYNNMKVHFEAN